MPSAPHAECERSEDKAHCTSESWIGAHSFLPSPAQDSNAQAFSLSSLTRVTRTLSLFSLTYLFHSLIIFFHSDRLADPRREAAVFQHYQGRKL